MSETCLAQLLIQLARKQEEEEYPAQRKADGAMDEDHTAYVAERILKLQPKKLSTISSAIGAMFQLQGGISEADKESIIGKFKKQKIISVSETGRVSYEKL